MVIKRYKTLEHEKMFAWGIRIDPIYRDAFIDRVFVAILIGHKTYRWRIFFNKHPK
jgi:hypothetical protein